MKIGKVVIEGIKSHQNTEFTLENYNTFVGENNSGKSNILFALRWFFKDGNLKLKNEDVTHDYNDDPQITIEFIFKEGEEIPTPFNDDYACEGNKFYIRAFRSVEDLEKKPQIPKHELIKEQESKSLSTADVRQLKELVYLIFVPSIRELGDEFKFSSNTTINRLVTKYVIDRVEAEEMESEKYERIKRSIEDLSAFISRGDESAFELLKTSLKNYMLDYRNVELDFQLEPPGISRLIKDSFKPSVKVSGRELPLESQGMGFQRSLIFSLLCNIADIENSSSNLSLYLIEEPELFLHPNHQNHFKNKLIDLSSRDNNQTILTSHSPYFLNNIQKEKYSQVKRVLMNDTSSIVKEISQEDISNICQQNGNLMTEAKNVCRDIAFTHEEFNQESEKIASEDELRYLLWIDPNRANAFLSKKVILVEGSSEKSFFSFIFDNPEGSFYGNNKTSEIMVLDTIGKFHLYKFAHLLFKLGIPTWIVYDGDNDKISGNRDNKISHRKINEYIVKMNDDNIIIDNFKFDSDIESFIGIIKENNPDIAIYNKLIKNENGCRDCENFETLMNFIAEVIDFEV